MSISMKSLLAAAVASLVVGNAMAADGTINFTGEIVAASCTMTGGAGTSVGGGKGNQIIDVNLGKVSVDSLGTTAGGAIAGGTNINLELDCGNTGTGLKVVKVKFAPNAGGSGTDTDDTRLLKTTGTAKNVGIGIFDTNNKLIDLGANDLGITGNLVEDDTDPQKIKYTAKLNLVAGYVRTNADLPIAGEANGTLPFTLSYE
ncbi:fimbrial protein [Pseudomonas aeruginosa]